MRSPINLRGKMLAFTFGVVAVLGASVAVMHHFVAEHAKSGS
jgi:hypothetical protein